MIEIETLILDVYSLHFKKNDKYLLKFTMFIMEGDIVGLNAFISLNFLSYYFPSYNNYMSICNLL